MEFPVRRQALFEELSRLRNENRKFRSWISRVIKWILVLEGQGVSIPAEINESFDHAWINADSEDLNKFKDQELLKLECSPDVQHYLDLDDSEVASFDGLDSADVYKYEEETTETIDVQTCSTEARNYLTVECQKIVNSDMPEDHTIKVVDMDSIVAAGSSSTSNELCIVSAIIKSDEGQFYEDKGVPPTYKCKGCDAKFDCEIDLSTHAIVHMNVRLNRVSTSWHQRKYLLRGRKKNGLPRVPVPNYVKNHPRIPCKCEFCGKWYPSRKHLYWHTSQVHPASGSEFICSQCGKSFSSFQKRSKHVRGVHSTRTFKCAYCPSTFSRLQTRHRHQNNVHLELGKRQCPQCGVFLKNGDSLIVHVASVHEGRRYKCNICSKQVTAVQMQRPHFKENHNEEMLTLPRKDWFTVINVDVVDTRRRPSPDDTAQPDSDHLDPDSDSSCVRRPRAHARRAKAKSDGPRARKTKAKSDGPNPRQRKAKSDGPKVKVRRIGSCGSAGRSADALVPARECPICHKSFIQLEDHLILHSEDQNCKCQFCDFQCTAYGTLFRHVQSRHMGMHRSRSGQPIEALVNCPYSDCQLTYNTYTEARRHLTESHPDFKGFGSSKRETAEKLAPRTKTPCQKCGKLIYWSGLRHHLKVMHGNQERGTYHCVICNKTFNRRDNLQMHEATKSHKQLQLEKEKREAEEVNFILPAPQFLIEELQVANMLL